MRAATAHPASFASTVSGQAARQCCWTPRTPFNPSCVRRSREAVASSREQPWAAPPLPLRRRVPAAQVQALASSAAGSDPSPTSKRVVITGGSRGLGFAMAQEFLRLGDAVVLCGRDEARLAAAVEALRQECGDAARVHGCRADCSSPEDMQRFGEFVRERLGGVDLWLNNQGEVTAKRLLADVDPQEIVRVVGSNVVGSLLGCRTAVALMRAQPGGPAAAGTGAAVPEAASAGGQGMAPPAGEPLYHIFNFGFSPWGAKFTRSAVTHKATKRALAQLNESLAEELREAGLTSIGVHNLSPGMLLTDLLLRDSTPAARRFFNALAEEPETVAAALVPRVRAVRGSGSSIDYLSPPDALLRILRGLPQIIQGGRFFDKEGRRVARGGELYQENGVRVQVRAHQLERQPHAGLAGSGRQ